MRSETRTAAAGVAAAADAWHALPARSAAVGAAALLGVVAGLQVALSLGAPLGEHVYGGRAAVVDGVLAQPYRLASGVAAGALCLAGWVLLRRVGAAGTGPPGHGVRVGTWLVAGWAAVNTVANLLSTSPVERWLLGGATAVVSALATRVARSDPR